MVVYRYHNNETSIAFDLYNPFYAVEQWEIQRKQAYPHTFTELAEKAQLLDEDCHPPLTAYDVDSMFLIMMHACPEQVIVKWDVRERVLRERFGLDHPPTPEFIARLLGDKN